MQKIRTILTVFKKEFTILMRYPTWIIQMIIWPLIFPLLYILTAMGFSGPEMSGLDNFTNITGTDNFVGFLIVGTMTWMCINILLWSFSGYLREEQMLGTLESNWLTPTNRFDLLIGSGLFNLSLLMFMNVIALLEYVFIYRVSFSSSPIMFLFSMLLMLPGAFGFGVIFASIVLWAKEVNAVVNVARGLIMILCGVSYPLSVLPGPMKVVSNFLPFTHGIKAARLILLNGYSLSQAAEPILYTLGIGLIYIIIGKLMFIYTENIAKKTGSFDRY